MGIENPGSLPPFIAHMYCPTLGIPILTNAPSLSIKTPRKFDKKNPWLEKSHFRNHYEVPILVGYLSMSNFSGPFTRKVDAYHRVCWFVGMTILGISYVSKYQTSKLNHQPPLWLIPSKKSLIWDSPPRQNTRLKDMNGVDAEEGQTLLEHVSQQKFSNKNKCITGKWYNVAIL